MLGSVTSNDSRINIPTIFVIFGVTGDLMARKIAPALFYLFRAHQLPAMFSVIGFSRRGYSDADLHTHLREALAPHLDGVPAEATSEFLNLFSYHQGMFEEVDAYTRLQQRLTKIDQGWGVCSNKLFYLATPPQSYETILGHLAASGLTKPCSPEEGWTRILVEKPFGTNLKEAEKLDQLLGSLFKEEQVYRIDHYLAKETLQNILAFRFSNNLLEDVWSRDHIEKIEVKLLETIDVEGRGAFYDSVGALLDVGQNHLLQMLALITMEHPMNFAASTIREKRAEILEALRPLSHEDVATHTVRGQYKGYRSEKGIASSSTTETYFKARTSLNTSRWQGVPIFLEGGKKMPKIQKEIIVTFRHPIPCLCPPNQHYQNEIHFKVEPEAGIAIQFWSKKSGSKMDLEKQMLHFQYVGASKGRYIGEYATLLLDAIAGDQTLFVSSRETLAGWRYIDPIVSAWRGNAIPLHVYAQDEKVFDSSKRLEVQKSEVKKEIGIIGLGKMGRGLALHLVEKGWSVIVFNRTAEVTKEFEKESGVSGAYSLEELIQKLSFPRIVWLMVPAGKPVDEMITKLVPLLRKGDTFVEGGNSFYKDSIRRAQDITKHGIEFVDVGVSGGPSGARRGASLMIGGKKEIFQKLESLFADIATEKGYIFFEGYGAGHFVKMIHNGIEYGMMQAIAEGFTVLKHSPYALDLSKVAEIYNHGSVIESRLIGWLKDGLDLHGESLQDVSGSVGHTGEGEWTVETARDLRVKTQVIEEALKFRVESEKNPSYTGKILSVLREQFGGHSAK